MKHLHRLLLVASAAFFIAGSASAQTVASHAFAIGKGPGVTGYTSLLCGSAQLAVGQVAADPICQTITGDVTISAAGVTAIGANKILNAMLATMAANTTKCNAAAGAAVPTDCTAATMRTNIGVVIGTNVQAWDADLDCLAAISTNGIIARTGAGTCAVRTVTAPAAGITISNPDGVAGNPTLALANDLAALEGLAGTGFATRTATDTWAQRTLQAPAAGLTITNPAGVAGDPTFALANDLGALEGLASTGIARRTGTDAWSVGTLVTNAELATAGAATLKGNPTVSTASVSDFTIQGLTNLAAPSATLDFIPIYDHVAGTIKNVTPGAIASSAVAGVASLNAKTGAVVFSVVKQIFTASGTYIPTTGMVYTIIECAGAGGGGGSAAGAVNALYSGAGGGSGGYSRLVATAATIGASKTVTIGAAGTGGASGSNNGTAGGDTSVSTLCIGKGGSGGLYGSAAQVPTAGAAGVAGTGDLTAAGMPGTPGMYSTSTAVAFNPSTGGSSFFGGGAAAVTPSSGVAVAGNAAGNYGSGGSGAAVLNLAANAAGGNGSAGVVFITEYIVN